MTESREKGLRRLARLREIAGDNAEVMAEGRERFARLAEPGAAPLVVSARQLFPTPPALAARAADLAEIRPGMKVLEPSAGTGRLIRAAWDLGAELYAVEIDRGCCDVLERMKAARELVDYRRADFLALTGADLGRFDRVLMNPPFTRGSDVKHVLHALGFLAPGGRLVSVVADGPRQRAALRPRASRWVELPAGSFRSEGTGVAAAVCVIDG